MKRKLCVRDIKEQKALTDIVGTLPLMYVNN